MCCPFNSLLQQFQRQQEQLRRQQQEHHRQQQEHHRRQQQLAQDQHRRQQDQRRQEEFLRNFQKTATLNGATVVNIAPSEGPQPVVVQEATGGQCVTIDLNTTGLVS